MTTPYLHAIQVLFAGLAKVLQQDHTSASEIAAALLSAAGDAAAVVDNAQAGGLPALRARVAEELLARRGQVITMAAPLCHPALVSNGNVQRLLREHEAEAARLMQLEDLLPHLGRDALLVTLGAVSTHDGRSDYMGLERIGTLDDPDPGPADGSGYPDGPANDEPGHGPHGPGCCCAPHPEADAADPEAA